MNREQENVWTKGIYGWCPLPGDGHAAWVTPVATTVPGRPTVGISFTHMSRTYTLRTAMAVMAASSLRLQKGPLGYAGHLTRHGCVSLWSIARRVSAVCGSALQTVRTHIV